MGNMQAMEMANLADLETGLRWHLQSNHYPPVPLAMLPVCVAAIEAGQDEDFDRLVDLPKGISHNRHGTKVPAGAIIESLHLDAWLNDETDDDA